MLCLLTARRYNFVSVTWRKHRAASWYFRQDLSRCKTGMARVFAITAGIILRTGGVAVQCSFGGRIYPRAGTWFWVHVQCRVTKRGRSQKIVPVQDFNWEQMSVSGYRNRFESFLCQPNSKWLWKIKRKKKVRAHTQLAVFARLAFTSPGKNRDKLMNYTGRVRGSKILEKYN